MKLILVMEADFSSKIVLNPAKWIFPEYYLKSSQDWSGIRNFVCTCKIN